MDVPKDDPRLLHDLNEKLPFRGILRMKKSFDGNPKDGSLCEQTDRPLARY